MKIDLNIENGYFEHLPRQVEITLKSTKKVGGYIGSITFIKHYITFLFDKDAEFITIFFDGVVSQDLIDQIKEDEKNILYDVFFEYYNKEKDYTGGNEFIDFGTELIERLEDFVISNGYNV